MRERQAELEALDVRVAVVTFDKPFLCRAYIEETGIEWPLLIDETRGLYEAYGMLRAKFLDVWGPASWLAYLRELRKGQRLRRAGADVMQRGGDVLIDPGGKVRLHHVGQGPANRPDVDALLQAIRKSQSGRNGGSSS